MNMYESKSCYPIIDKFLKLSKKRKHISKKALGSIYTNNEDNFIMNQSVNHNLGWVSYDISDFLPKEFFIENKLKGRSILHRKFTKAKVDLEKSQELLKNENEFDNCTQYWAIDSDKEYGYIKHINNDYLIEFIKCYNEMVITVYAINDEKLTNNYNFLNEKIADPVNEPPHTSWYYKTPSGIESIQININGNNLPCTEMYPMLYENGKILTEYYNDYMNSESTILVLIGPPGTGKTSFIKGFLNHSKYNSMSSSEPEVLYSDKMFITFITDDKTDAFIVEDADNFLVPRENNNPVMHKILSASDGFLSIPKKKKMIFSTNLESIDKIDSALIRPGRCFDILKFDKLNDDQSKLLANKFDVSLENITTQRTLAEIMTGIKNRKNDDYKLGDKKSLGFI